MKFITGWDRAQAHLLPERLEDYVGPDNLVRFLDAWVDTLDLRALKFRFPKEDRHQRGAPSYAPGTLLRLYLYGYFHQIRSSRRLEAECGRNLELLWLLGKLTPDFKTIADFRKNNAESFQSVLRQFNQLCRQENLFGGELLAIDGTKVKAVNAADQSRAMKSKGRHVVGYNVQGVADSKHHLLVTTEVTNAASDQGQLVPMAQAAKVELELERADVVADGGYMKSQDIKDCQDAGLEPHLPAVQNSPSERAGFYGKADFKYDAAQDVYHCPAGAQLPRVRKMTDKGRILFNYADKKACAKCPLKSRCTKVNYRTVSRWEHEERLERMMAKVQAEPEKLARRKTIIEHCWGTLHWLLPGGFLVKGLKKVRAEVSLAAWTYNLKRALAVLGLKKLMAVVGKTATTATGTVPTGAKVPAGLRMQVKHSSGWLNYFRCVKLTLNSYRLSPLRNL